MRVRRDGTSWEPLTDGTVHSGFPSYSADGKQIVFRVWGEEQKGLRILNLEDRGIRVLTNEYDNLPGWSREAEHGAPMAPRTPPPTSARSPGSSC
ncbi:hypothetical protein JRI60_24270 [Archangium violaceum]|uniref:TolB family protein n=1 Tax=Archangium violaceum TaxID=83451 RepID=UPI001951609D|nr:hypothetical protein [Archangium violaceum]QRO01908.1 hypothetical protein JRI60_24270 [Archangium violaceum]